MLRRMHVLALSMVLVTQAPSAPADSAAPQPTPTSTAPTTPPAAEAGATPAQTPVALTEHKPVLPPKTMPRLLVLDLIDKGAGPEVTSALSQAVQGQAVQSHLGETVTATQIRLLIDANANQQLVGCDSEVCMTDVGRLIEADLILGGNVAKVGDDFVITILTVDPRDGKRQKQEQRKAPGNRELYYYAGKQLTSLVLTGRAADPRVPVLVRAQRAGADLDGATFIVDGKDVGTGAFVSVPLEPGSHEVRVKKQGHAEWKTLVTVEEATPLQVTASLVDDRVELWPVAIGTGVATVILGGIAFVTYDLALGTYDGSGLIFGSREPQKSYLGATPTSSSELCAKEQSIALLVGRAPSEGESLGTKNGCEVAAGPGIAVYALSGAIATAVASGALITTDLVLGAMAE